MALPNLSGSYIQDTYQRIVQYDGGGNFYDGTGSLLNSVFPVGDPFPYTGSAIITGSLEVTGSGTSYSGTSFAVQNNDVSTTYPLFHINEKGDVDLGANPYNGRYISSTYPELRIKGSQGVIGSDGGSFILRAGKRFAIQHHPGYTEGVRFGTFGGSYYAGFYGPGDFKLGIGTSTPSEKITVVGNISASGNFITDNNITASGHVSASTYYGDGSNLTGITHTDISALNTFTGSIQSEVDSLTSSTSSYATTSSVDALTAVTSSYLTSIPSTYFNSSLLETQNITKNFNYTSSLNVVEITSSVEGAIIDYRLTNLDNGSRVGTFMYAHDGTTLSYNDITIPGAGIGADPILSATLTGSIVSIDIENAAGFNFSGFAKKFSKLNVPVIVYDPNVLYFLDIADNDPVAAFSLRQLSQLYTGSAIRVREDDTNTEADIGFDLNGNLDEAAIISHCGSANGYVTTWYDQSGNNNHATQSSAGNQLTVYNGSSVYKVNGKASLYSSGENKSFTHNMPAGTTWTTFDTFKPDNTFTVGIHSVTQYTPWLYLGDNTTQTNVTNGFSNFEIYQNTQQMSISTRLQFKTDVNNEGHQLIVAFGDANLSSKAWRLNSSYGGNYGTKGWLQESIIYNIDESSKRSDYETNINNYYSMYDTGLLEDYSGAAAAYSVRQLTTAFTSSMNIRRASDNAEQVIGFTSTGDLDTDSIETFCAGTECYVDTWYDQSGNENNAEQTNANGQPLIYSASAVITENGKPAIRTIGQSAGVLQHDNISIDASGGYTSFAAKGSQTDWGSPLTAGAFIRNTVSIRVYGNNQNLYSFNSSNNFDRYVLTARKDNRDYDVYKGTTNIDSRTLTIDQGNTFSQIFKGANFDANSTPDNCFLHEVIIYDSALSYTDVTSIQNNIITAFY